MFFKPIYHSERDVTGGFYQRSDEAAEGTAGRGWAKELGAKDKATGLFQAQMMKAEIGRWGGTWQSGEKGSDSGYVLKVVEIANFEVVISKETFHILALGG